MASKVDLDEMPCSAASHLGLHSLFRPVGANTYGKYGMHQHVKVSEGLQKGFLAVLSGLPINLYHSFG